MYMKIIAKRKEEEMELYWNKFLYFVRIKLVLI